MFAIPFLLSVLSLQSLPALGSAEGSPVVDDGGEYEAATARTCDDGATDLDDESLRAALRLVAIEDHERMVTEPADLDLMDDSFRALVLGTVYVCCSSCVPCTFGGVVQICCSGCLDSSAAADCSGWKIVIQTPQNGTPGGPCGTGMYAYTGLYGTQSAVACLKYSSLP